MPLGNRIQFYGVEIGFPKGTPLTFSVTFVLSNSLITQNPSNTTQYTLDFPELPSLTKSIAQCNVSVFLPPGSTYLDGTIDSLAFSKENLPAFTYSPATVTLLSPEKAIQLFDIRKLNREVRIIGTGNFEISDTYHVTNKASTRMSSIRMTLPQNASNPAFYEQLGREVEVLEAIENTYEIVHRSPLEPGTSSIFIVRYSLPSSQYIKQEEPRSFHVEFPVFENPDCYVNSSFTTFVLPEGARILSFTDVSGAVHYSVSKGVFQEALTISRQGAFSLDSIDIGITYKHDILWLSFRPTFWILAITAVACVVAFVWKRPKAPLPLEAPEVTVRIRPEEIRSFADIYGRRTKTRSRIKSLEERARKGKISRRRYKVQRKTLETRLNTFSRKIDDLRQKFRVAGGRYRDLMNRLEIAETEINEVESNIDSIETQHRRGDLSLGAYRKLLADYEQRKEKAETTISEILIRLREEIR